MSAKLNAGLTQFLLRILEHREDVKQRKLVENLVRERAAFNQPPILVRQNPTALPVATPTPNPEPPIPDAK